MLVTYIGPHKEVDVVIAGEDFGRVKKGESLVVPDGLASEDTFAPNLWQVGTPAKKNSEKE